MKKLTLSLLALATPILSFAQEAERLGGEANLKMPENFSNDPKTSILYWGFAVVILGLLFGFWQFSKIRKLRAHKSMLEIGNVIFKTCSTYLKQQGKFLFSSSSSSVPPSLFILVPLQTSPSAMCSLFFLGPLSAFWVPTAWHGSVSA